MLMLHCLYTAEKSPEAKNASEIGEEVMKVCLSIQSSLPTIVST